MSKNEIVAKIEVLKELEALAAEISAEMETVKDAIKEEMNRQNTEELDAGKYIVRWTTTLSNRFDTAAFKKVMPGVYKEYTKQVMTRRFSIC